MSGIAVVSPHLDDAVLSCARHLEAHPGSHLVTVFAGGPKNVGRISDWDRAAGFTEGDDVMAARRTEDHSAASLLSATTCHLDYWDGQYRSSEFDYEGPDADAELIEVIAAELTIVVARLDVQVWLTPLGIFHSDHQLTAAACRRVARSRADKNWVIYEELPYWVEFPDSRQAAWLAAKDGEVRCGAEISVKRRSRRTSRKEELVGQYRSQVMALGHRRVKTVVNSTERYHEITIL